MLAQRSNNNNYYYYYRCSNMFGLKLHGICGGLYHCLFISITIAHSFDGSSFNR